MELVLEMLRQSWEVLREASVYMIFGLVVGGLVTMFLQPESVARHLGKGRFLPVLKATLLGVPLPLCSCGVLPAAAALKRQGANNGAVTSFLISTPESGVDSVAISYALLDPLLTVVRPLAAMATAAFAGLSENIWQARPTAPDPLAGPGQLPGASCCCGGQCSAPLPPRSPSLASRAAQGLRASFGELWGDIAVPFLIGTLLAGAIGAFIPQSLLGGALGGGLGSMLLMLAVGVPLYICASSSTPIAAALILKGASPGAALVFLLAGPATNITSLTVITKLLGRRGTAIYLFSIAAGAVVFGLAVDQLYAWLGVSVQASLGRAGALVPAWARTIGGVILLAMSVRPVWAWTAARLRRWRGHPGA